MNTYEIIAKARQTAILCILVLLIAGCDEPQGFSDYFNTNGVFHPDWEQFPDPGPDSYEISNGWLTITASRGQDLWGGIPLKRGAPLLLRTAPTGNYALESHVNSYWSRDPGDYPRINTQVGLFVFEDVENWLFFGFTYHRSQAGEEPDGNGLIITSTIGDVSTIEHYEDFGPPLIGTLKIEKSGNSWLFYVKPDSSWNQIGSTVQADFGEHKVGMGAKSFQSGGTAVRGHFDYIRASIN